MTKHDATLEMMRAYLTAMAEIQACMRLAALATKRRPHCEQQYAALAAGSIGRITKRLKGEILCARMGIDTQAIRRLAAKN